MSQHLTTPFRSSLTEINLLRLPYAAAAYGERGWPVLPLKPREKIPLTTNGLLDASFDAEVISQWWSRWPDANIGLRTGESFDVLDVDGLAGSEAVANLKNMAPEGWKHQGPVSATGKGFHLLFIASGTRNSAGKIPGLDIRGHNGYIVAPPSIHPNGHKYQWMSDVEFLAPFPEWLDPLTRPPSNPVSSERDTSNQVPILEVFELWEKDHPLIRKNNYYTTTCIFHDDDTPSMVIYPDTNSFYCFGCHAWGDALNLTHYIRTGELR